ncbi:hypothetical protein PVAP13_3KG096927 [Panicum virgatum]|uniref:Uncharacterized protein n=1 Tax=Panicum virgatum TaxID=38727 RepID=A0A8T0UP35_PANVG|nr:hypothetical protein PVAP13_3KG096927 [Panicum virgatum]
MAWFIPTWTKLDAAHPAFLQPAGDEDEGERTGVRRARTVDSTPCWQLVRPILAARGRSDDQESPGWTVFHLPSTPDGNPSAQRPEATGPARSRGCSCLARHAGAGEVRGCSCLARHAGAGDVVDGSPEPLPGPCRSPAHAFAWSGMGALELCDDDRNGAWNHTGGKRSSTWPSERRSPPAGAGLQAVAGAVARMGVRGDDDGDTEALVRDAGGRAQPR